ncbi:MAG: YihY/virulence factor BrkB family protein [Candidatus Acidiferrum sp.]
MGDLLNAKIAAADWIRTHWGLGSHQKHRWLRKLLGVAERFWAGWQVQAATDMAAEVSFYFVLSCFPFLMVLTALLSWMHRTSGWYAFSFWLTDYMPTSARDTVLTTMEELSKDSGRFFSLGLVLTIWSASTGFLSLMDALSKIYGVKDERSYLKRRVIAVCATVVAAVFLVICFGVWSAGHMVAGLLFRDMLPLDTRWRLVRWVVTLGMISLAVDLINYFLPRKQLPWRWVTPGTLLTALCFVVASALLSLYANHNPNISRIYGTLTGFIVMMLWIYLLNLSMLLGAQTDAAVAGPVGVQS